MATVRNAELAALAGRLETARGRARAGLALTGALAGLAAGLVVLLAAEALRQAAPDAWQSVADALGLGSLDPRIADIVVALAIAALAAIAAVAVALSRTPDMPRLARSADDTFGLNERVSTALEVDAAGATGGPVVAALLQDASRRAGAVDSRRLAPVRVPPVLWIALGLPLLVVLALQLIPERAAAPAAPVTVAAEPPPVLAAEEQATIAAEIQRVADLLVAEAAPEGDPILEAVARTLTRVSEQTATADAVERTELAAELERLADSGRAGSQAPQPAGQNAPAPTESGALDRLESLMREIDPAQFAAPTERFDAAPIPPGTGQMQVPNAGDAQERPVMPTSGEAGIGDGTGRPPSSDFVEGNIGGQQIDLATDQFAEENQDPTVSQARQGGSPMSEAQPGNIGVETQQAPGQSSLAPTAGQPGQQGAPAGLPGADGQTPGDLAGVGAQAPDAAGPMTATDLFELDDEGMVLEAELNATGRRIQIEAPPVPQQSTVVGPPAPPTPEGWLPTAEEAVARLMLNPAARDLVARYFMAEPAR